MAPMATGSPARRALWPKIALAIASPIVFLLITEAVVRVSGVETDVARNENFEIAVPVWLLADPNWVDIQRGRLERPRGVRAVDVEWLRHFEEARYMEYKLKPNVSAAAVFDHYARDLDPDLLIISFGANDARDVLEPAAVVLGRDDGWRGGVREALMRFETFRLMRRLLFAVQDPFAASRARAAAEGDRRRLVKAVPIEDYKANLHYLIEQGRSIGASSVLLSVCAPPRWSRAMGEVADEAGVPLVDALALFRTHLDDLREHRLYADEVRYAESIYGLPDMQANWRLYVTTDGCHPGRAGQSLIADALAESIAALDWR